MIHEEAVTRWNVADPLDVAGVDGGSRNVFVSGVVKEK